LKKDFSLQPFLTNPFRVCMVFVVSSVFAQPLHFCVCSIECFFICLVVQLYLYSFVNLYICLSFSLFFLLLFFRFITLLICYVCTTFCFLYSSSYLLCSTFSLFILLYVCPSTYLLCLFACLSRRNIHEPSYVLSTEALSVGFSAFTFFRLSSTFLLPPFHSSLFLTGSLPLSIPSPARRDNCTVSLPILQS